MKQHNIPYINEVITDYSPNALKASSKALSWVAEELANSNDYSKEQIKTLKQLLKSNNDLMEFFTTAKSDGFAALRDKRFETTVEEIIRQMKEPTRNIVHEEIKKIWIKFSIVLGVFLTILTFVYDWISTDKIEAAVKTFIQNMPK